MVAPALTGVLGVVPLLKDTITTGAFEGESNGVLGILGGLVSGVTTGFQYISAEAAIKAVKGERNKFNNITFIDVLLILMDQMTWILNYPCIKIGSDPEQNEIITTDIMDAFKLALAKRDAKDGDDDGDFDAVLNDVNDLLNFVLRYYLGLVGKYVLPSLGSALHGLVDGLTNGIHEHGLIGGALDGVYWHYQSIKIKRALEFSNKYTTRKYD